MCCLKIQCLSALRTDIPTYTNISLTIYPGYHDDVYCWGSQPSLSQRVHQRNRRYTLLPPLRRKCQSGQRSYAAVNGSPKSVEVRASDCVVEWKSEATSGIVSQVDWDVKQSFGCLHGWRGRCTNTKVCTLTSIFVECQLVSTVSFLPIRIVGSRVRPHPFLFYPHPFYKGTLDTENSRPPPF